MKKLLVLIFLIPILNFAQIVAPSDSLVQGQLLFQPLVYFELAKPVIRSESYPALDSIVTFLNDHPALIVEVGNHGDSRTSDYYSMNLTQRRAQAIVDYLISRGIDSQRLIAKGYSDSKLLISDAEIAKLKTKEEIEAAHQKNRRTEFTILSTQFVSPQTAYQNQLTLKNQRIAQFYELNRGNNLPSKSIGSVSEGKLENGKLVPFYGTNYTYFDTLSYFEHRAYLHDRVLATVLDTYKEFELLVPGKKFFLMECSNQHGGKMFPHHTHQNGLSIDFMSPLLKDGKPYEDLDTIGIDHYWMKFNQEGKYEKDETVSIDFNLIAQHILVLETVARKYGLKISKVIFKLELKEELFATDFGKELYQTGIYFAKNLTDQINELHDDHYHVDFEFI